MTVIIPGMNMNFERVPVRPTNVSFFNLCSRCLKACIFLEFLKDELSVIQKVFITLVLTVKLNKKHVLVTIILLCV